MTTRNITEILRHYRNLLLWFPIFFITLLTILFLYGGGGKTEELQLPMANNINLTIPPAHNTEEKGLDKMAIYHHDELDSIHKAQKQKQQDAIDPSLSNMKQDSNVEKANSKVAALQRLINSSPTLPVYHTGAAPYTPPATMRPSGPSPDIERLEHMLQVIKEGGTAPDPELQGLNKTLDKLILAQHPGSVTRDTTTQPSSALPVHAAMGEDPLPGSSSKTKVGRFYDLDTENGEDEQEPIAMISARVPETQTLIDGAMIRLDLNTELVIRGDHISAGTPLYGMTKLNNERLLVTIHSIRYKQQIYPVDLQVMDQDGLAGIYEPGSLTRDATRESAGQGLSSFGQTTLDPSLGGQAASAGIQMARGLVTKKVRQIKVSVKAGYQVFLQDLSQKHS